MAYLQKTSSTRRRRALYDPGGNFGYEGNGKNAPNAVQHELVSLFARELQIGIIWTATSRKQSTFNPHGKTSHSNSFFFLGPYRTRSDCDVGWGQVEHTTGFIFLGETRHQRDTGRVWIVVIARIQASHSLLLTLGLTHGMERRYL